MPAPLLHPKKLLEEKQVSALTEDEQKHIQEMKRRWSAYREGPPNTLEVLEGSADDNIPIPYEKVLVDKQVSYLFGKDELEFEIEEIQPEIDPAPKPTAAVERKGAKLAKEEKKKSPAQQFLDDFWEKNRKMTFLKKVGTNGSVFGHAFVKIVPRIIDGKQIPRLINLDPLNMRAIWDPGDIEETIGYRVRWEGFDDDGRAVTYQQVIFRENGEENAEYELDELEEEEYTWRIVDMKSQPDTNVWEITNDVTWEYEWSPVVDCQHYPIPNEYWGVSDIENGVLAMNKSVSRMLSNINRVIKFWGHPRMWVSGVAGNLIQQMIDKGQLDMRPDSLLVLPTGGPGQQPPQVGSLEMQGDMTAALDLYARIKELYHEVTRMPEVATGKMDAAGNLSGVALEILYGPILEATEDKRRTYGEMLKELCQRVLELGGYPDLKVNVVWPEVMPHDPGQEASTMTQHKALGVSTDTALTKLGYDPDEEREKRNSEAEENIQRQEQMMERGVVAPSNPATKARQDQKAVAPDEEPVQDRTANRPRTGGGFPRR